MSPTEHRALLRPTAILDYTHPRIEALIQSRGWRRLPTRERIAAIYDFVRNDIAFGYNLPTTCPPRACWTMGWASAIPRAAC